MSKNTISRSSGELGLVDSDDRPVATPASDGSAVTFTSHRTDTTNTLDKEQNQLLKSEATEPVTLTDQTNLLPFRKVMAVFAGLSLCMFVSTLDSVIVATALPTIGDFFDAGAIASWVPSAYLLTSTAFQPLYGRLSDIFGRKATLCLAMGLFMLGCLLAGFARSIEQLIVFRGIAGVGGGAIISMSQIIISDVVSLRERGKFQGIIGVVVAFGYAVGPILGGALAQKINWRVCTCFVAAVDDARECRIFSLIPLCINACYQWCFWIEPPVSLAATIVVMIVLPLKAVEGNFRRKLIVIDYTGAALTLAGCTLLILPLIWGGVTFPWSSPVVVAPLCSGFLVIGLFCLWEWKGARLPIVPMYIFKHITVTGVYIAMFVNGMVFYSSLFYLPQFFQVALGYSPIRSGIFLFPVLVSQTLMSALAGQIVSRTGRYRAITYLGFAVWAVGCGCLSTVTGGTSKALLVLYMLLSGFGAGQTMQPTTVAAQASVSRKDMSVVTAVRNFVKLLGGTLSLAIGATIINNALQDSMLGLGMSTNAIKAIIDSPTTLGDRFSAASSSKLSDLGITENMAVTILDGYTNGFRTVFILNACFSALATVTSFLMIRHKELSRGDETQLKAATSSHGLEKDRGGVNVHVLSAGTVHDIGNACSALERYGQQGAK